MTGESAPQSAPSPTELREIEEVVEESRRVLARFGPVPSAQIALANHLLRAGIPHWRGNNRSVALSRCTESVGLRRELSRTAPGSVFALTDLADALQILMQMRAFCGDHRGARDAAVEAARARLQCVTEGDDGRSLREFATFLEAMVGTLRKCGLAQTADSWNQWAAEMRQRAKDEKKEALREAERLRRYLEKRDTSEPLEDPDGDETQ